MNMQLMGNRQTVANVKTLVKRYDSHPQHGDLISLVTIDYTI